MTDGYFLAKKYGVIHFTNTWEISKEFRPIEINQEDKITVNFGIELGLAFQLQDDYLDCFGNPKTFGKKVGGDIITNKKTFLYLKTLQRSNETDARILKQLFSIFLPGPLEMKKLLNLYQVK